MNMAEMLEDIFNRYAQKTVPSDSGPVFDIVLSAAADLAVRVDREETKALGMVSVSTFPDGSKLRIRVKHPEGTIVAAIKQESSK